MRIPLNERLSQIAQAHLGKPLVLGMRPEHFTRCADDDAAAISTHVEVGEPLGAESFIHLVTPAGDKLVVRLAGIVQSGIGQALYVKPNLDEAHLFEGETELRLGE